MINYQSILSRITSDPRYRANLDWGKPRRGHPEGAIRTHIIILEKNLTSLSYKLSEEDQEKLRILIHVHDTFKPDATDGTRITDSRSHASLARAFLAEFLNTPDLLNMIQFHDEPYALYLQFENQHRIDQTRIDALINLIQNWNLFLAFLIIDNCTPGKSRQPLLWLFVQLQSKVDSVFNPSDIIP